MNATNACDTRGVLCATNTPNDDDATTNDDAPTNADDATNDDGDGASTALVARFPGEDRPHR